MLLLPTNPHYHLLIGLGISIEVLNGSKDIQNLVGDRIILLEILMELSRYFILFSNRSSVS